MGKAILVLRIKGQVNVPEDVENTLKRLRLYRKNFATLVDDNDNYMGMLKKCMHYIAWCEADSNIIEELLRKRGRKVGDKGLTDEDAKAWGYKDLSFLAKALGEGKVKLKELKGLKPFFRLNSPKGGFNTKRLYPQRGVLGKNPELPEIVKTML
ncbi:MAG: 50S ribosomal protein L30 [Nitrososphaerales archaeon]